MGMALDAGGHLTHGHGVSVTGKWFRAVRYGVRRDTGTVDMDEVRELALRERPKLIFCGGTAIDRKSTRLNSSHANISYAVFCLKKKNNNRLLTIQHNYDSHNISSLAPIPYQSYSSTPRDTHNHCCSCTASHDSHGTHINYLLCS